MAEQREIPYVVQNPDCSISYDILHWENGIRKARNNSINIQIACVPYDRMNEFIQAEGNNVLALHPFINPRLKTTLTWNVQGSTRTTSSSISGM